MLPINEFSRFYQALGSVKSATNGGDCNIMCLGDSICSGWFDAGWNSNYRPYSWPTMLAGLLSTKLGLPAASLNYLSADTGTGGSNDGRVSLSGGFIKASGVFSLGGISFQCGSAGSLTFTPGDGLSYDSVDIFGSQNQVTATISVSVNGGSATNETFSGSTTSKVSVTGTASTSASVTISWVSGNSNVYAVLFRSSTQPRINIMNNGVGGALTSAFMTPKAFEIMTAINPAAALISLGVNDAVSLQSYPSLYSQTVDNLVSFLTANSIGAIVSTLAVGIRTGQPADLEREYSTALLNRYQNGLPTVDLAGAIGGNNTFFFNSDHPNQAGYNIIARLFSEVF